MALGESCSHGKGLQVAEATSVETTNALNPPLPLASLLGAPCWQNPLEAIGQGSECDAVHRGAEQSREGREWVW